ncbi:MAG TPA: histidine kinase [Mycobacteriales bacterium]|nr:histidine kinase [Mycobacteriales bacterium]
MASPIEAWPESSDGSAQSAWASLVRDSEREADSLADAVHDGLMQSLVVIRYALAWERSQAAGPRPTGTGSDALPDPDSAVQTCLADARRLVWHLRRRVHDADGLPAALDELTERLAADGGPELLHEVAASGLTLEQAVVVYRMIQEWARAAAPEETLQVRVTQGEGSAVLVEATGPALVPASWPARGSHLGVRWAAMPR